MTGVGRGREGSESKVNESAARRDRHGVCPVARSQLLHDVFEVNLDRFFGDKESPSDIPIPISTRDVAQNVDLAIRERFVADMLGDLRSNLRRDALVAGMDLANHLNHPFRGHVFQKIPLRSGLQSALNFDIAGEHR